MISAERHKPRYKDKVGNVASCTKEAVSILGKHPDGLGAGELVKRIHKKLPSVPIWTVRASVSSFLVKRNDIERVERGWYRLKNAGRRRTIGVRGPKESQARRDESKFYEPFALWLCLSEDCTKFALTGKKTKGRGKWTTPDVIGLVECDKTAVAQFSTEVVTAEIKAGTGWDDLITAFAQACSYRLCSHVSWIVVPKSSDKEALDRLSALCHMFEIGLAVFDLNDPLETMIFEIRIRPTKQEPDYYYAEQLLRGKKFRHPPENEEQGC